MGELTYLKKGPGATLYSVLQKVAERGGSLRQGKKGGKLPVRPPNRGKTMKNHTSDSQKKDEGVAWA